jgi:hypothetical protein
MASNHPGYWIPDCPLQDLQVARRPGLSIALRSAGIRGFSK